MIKIRPPPSMVKPNGSLAYCSGCRRRFSVTPYTAYTARGPICHACGNNAAEDAEASAATARTKAQPAKRTPGAAARRKALLELQADRLPTLQELCITVLSRHTELIDDLSGVGDASQEKISQAISRNRRLNDDTVKLFLAPDLKELKLYDCSEVSAHTLRTLPDFCPQLEKINLQLCGQIDNDVLDAWGHKLGARHQLRSVELYGPFLVRQEAWQRFFQRVGSHLTSFKIRESARFNLPCTRSLAEHCPHLTELGLAQIGPLDGPALRPLHAFTNLTYLDISDPGVSAPGVPPKSLQDQDVLELLFHVGSHLQFLDVSGNADLSDAFLLAPRGGIKWTCRALLELNLSQLRLTAQGIKELFSDWKLDPPPPPPLQQCLLRGPSTPPGAGLRTLHLGRVRSVDDAVLEAVVRHSGPTLQWLSLNSDDELTGEGLGSLLRPERLPALRFLDVSFVRDVSDATVSPFLDIKESKRIHVFGCNRIVRLPASQSPALFCSFALLSFCWWAVLFVHKLTSFAASPPPFGPTGGPP